MAKFVPTNTSIEVGEAIAKAHGVKTESASLLKRSGSFYADVFSEVKEAFKPKFDHIKIDEFTRMQVNAFATSNYDTLGVKIDQYLDFWLMPVYQLVTMRAFYRIEGDNLAVWQDQFETALMTRFDASAYRERRHEFAYLFEDFPEAARISHHLSLASLVFVICHELAHHELDHFNQPYAQRLEYEADARGFELLQLLYQPDRIGTKLHWRPFSRSGASIFLRLLDVSDHLQVWKTGRETVRSGGTHPSSEDRFDRIMLSEQHGGQVQRDSREFWGGFGPVCDRVFDEFKQKYQKRG
jgi:hypothetical protein